MSPSLHPSKRLTKKVRDEKLDQLDQIAQNILDTSSKRALWIMSISTAVLALPVLWAILRWLVLLVDKIAK